MFHHNSPSSPQPSRPRHQGPDVHHERPFNAAQRNGVVACRAARYTRRVIKSFQHKGLETQLATGSHRGVRPDHARRLRLQLAALDTAQTIDDMDIPGFRLHQLKGRTPSRWSIWVNGNYRLTFEFRDGNAYVLDYEDYH